MVVLLFKVFIVVLLILFGFFMVYGYLLIVLYMNDYYGWFDEIDISGGFCFLRLVEVGECFGGVVRRVIMIKKIWVEEKNVLFFFGGDVFMGMLWYLVYCGNVLRKFMNEFGYDVMVYSFFFYFNLYWFK